jgi:hypothetical protein
MEKLRYPDEEILQKRQERLKEEHTTLENGMYINGEIITFEREDILETFSIMIPVDFSVMEEEYSRVKYPSVFRPQYLLTSLDLSTDFGFNVFSDNLGEMNTLQVTEQIQKTLLGEQDVYEFSEVEEIEGTKIYWFDFHHSAMDSTVYHIISLFRVEQKIVQVNFNCILTEHQDWKNAVIKMLESVEQGS